MESYIRNAKGIPKNKVLVSIIIPCRNKKEIVYKYPKECELIIVVGNEPPGRLRDYGAGLAKGKYLAFIDSDAYPSQDWYTHVSYYSRCFKIFCGPGVIPPGSSFREMLSDMIYKFLPYRYRVFPCRARQVPEFPTFNLIIKRDYFLALGGFSTDMITGEDTLLCRKTYGPFYFPEVMVYHRRRPFGFKFFKQISYYGRNRGYLIALAFPIIPIALVLVVFIYLVCFLKGVYETLIPAKRI